MPNKQGVQIVGGGKIFDPVVGGWSRDEGGQTFLKTYLKGVKNHKFLLKGVDKFLNCLIICGLFQLNGF